MSPKLKIAIIGAGSVEFTKKLCIDILCVPELQDIEIALTDINQHNLDMVRQIVERIVEVNKLPTRVTATTDRRKAFEGARYIINCVRIGGLEAFATDIQIPLKYGVDQCVGDTICAGGIMYGQRTIPALLDFCKDIREVSEPGAKMLNYANPMAMNTWAAIEHGKVDTIGLCHGVQNGWRQIASALGAKHPNEVDFICTGINHQTWYIDIRFRGRRIGRDELVAAFERHPSFRSRRKSASTSSSASASTRPSRMATSPNISLVSQAPRRNPSLDRHVRVDPWRDGRISALFHREPELVRDRLPAIPRGSRQTHRRSSGRTSTPATSSRRWRPAALPRPLQRQEPRPHHQPARGCLVESTGFVDRIRAQHGRGSHAVRCLCRHLLASVNVQRMR